MSVKFSQMEVGGFVEHFDRRFNKIVRREIVRINKDKTVAVVKNFNGKHYRIRNKDVIRYLGKG